MKCPHFQFQEEKCLFYCQELLPAGDIGGEIIDLAVDILSMSCCQNTPTRRAEP